MRCQRHRPTGLFGADGSNPARRQWFRERQEVAEIERAPAIRRRQYNPVAERTYLNGGLALEQLQAAGAPGKNQSLIARRRPAA